MRITRTDVAGWLDRLSAVLHRPDGGDDEVVGAYFEALQYLPREAVEDAVKLVLRTEERYFPKPATLVRHARSRMPQQDQHRSPHHAWLASPFGDYPKGIEESLPCPDCGSVWRWLERQREDGTWTPARLHILCDVQRHRQAQSRAVATYRPGDVMRPDTKGAEGDYRTLAEIQRDVARHVTLPEPVKQDATSYRPAA